MLKVTGLPDRDVITTERWVAYWTEAPFMTTSSDIQEYFTNCKPVQIHARMYQCDRQTNGQTDTSTWCRSNDLWCWPLVLTNRVHDRSARPSTWRHLAPPTNVDGHYFSGGETAVLSGHKTDFFDRCNCINRLVVQTSSPPASDQRPSQKPTQQRT